jgi:hypothetical protein
LNVLLSLSGEGIIVVVALGVSVDGCGEEEGAV